jgi:hypothetical protein
MLSALAKVSVLGTQAHASASLDTRVKLANVKHARTLVLVTVDVSTSRISATLQLPSTSPALAALMVSEATLVEQSTTQPDGVVPVWA